MELKLNKMNKALFRDRAKKLMLTGALAGVIAGVAITSRNLLNYIEKS